MKKDLLVSSIIIILLYPTLSSFIFSDRPNLNQKIFINQVEKKFGIPIDEFEIETAKVKNNQTLFDILSKFDVPFATIDCIAKKAKPVFDVRKIRSGHELTFFRTKDSANAIAYMVYEPSPSSYVVFNFHDSCSVSLKEVSVNIIEKTASAQITSSLWNAMVENNLNPELSNQLSEIYAWTIDFFGLQKGDEFKFIYQEVWTTGKDSKMIALGKIKAAWFKNEGKEIYAIPFEQDSVTSFFDQEGNSLRRAFLKAPLQFSRISSRFTSSRFHPVLKIFRPHYGVDYAAAVGTPIHTVGDGTVVEIGNGGGGGRVIKIRHNSVYTTGYMHLSAFAKEIKKGKHVAQGDIIGYVGQSGLATGPHLDFRFWKNGSPVDPAKVEAPHVDPIKDSNKQKFNKSRDEFIKALNNTVKPIV